MRHRTQQSRLGANIVSPGHHNLKSDILNDRNWNINSVKAYIAFSYTVFQMEKLYKCVK